MEISMTSSIRDSEYLQSEHICSHKNTKELSQLIVHHPNEPIISVNRADLKPNSGEQLMIL